MPQMVPESHSLIFAGLATLPLSFYARYYGVKHLHFLEHDESISEDDEL